MSIQCRQLCAEDGCLTPLEMLRGLRSSRLPSEVMKQSAVTAARRSVISLGVLRVSSAYPK